MKKLASVGAFVALFSLFFVSFLNAQVVSVADCGTTEHLAYLKKHGQNPTDFQAKMTQNGPPTAPLVLKRCGQLPVIPVVVHVFHLGEAVGSGSNISDAQIQATINGLNDKWANLNALGVPLDIRFELARRDPMGNATNGINRINCTGVAGYAANGISFNGSAGPPDTQIKDLSRWPITDYYNIWVVHKINGFPAGYAFFPGSGPGNVYDGTIILAGSMTYGSGVLAHEMGHAWSLAHTFAGDDPNNTMCPANADCTTDGDGVCDTPPHKQGDCGATNPCTAMGNWNNSRYNYMSYCGGDRFTAGQKVRVLNAMAVSVRRYLLESKALIPVNAANEMAFEELVFPTLVACTPTFQPIIKVHNYGTTAAASFDYELFLDGASLGIFTQNAVSIPSGQTMNVSLTTVAAAAGTHSFQVVLQKINGVAGPDLYQYDNQLCGFFQRKDPISNICDDFEDGNLDGAMTWQDSSAIHWKSLTTNCPTEQNASMVVDGTASNSKEFEFVIGPLNLTGLAKPALAFDIAREAAFYCNNFATLTVTASTDCGQTTTTVFEKNDAPMFNCGGVTYTFTPEPLNTTGGATTGTIFSPNACSDWRRELIDLAAYANQTVTLRFFVKYEAGGSESNIIYLDNICLNKCTAPTAPFAITPVPPDTVHLCIAGSQTLTLGTNQATENNVAYLWQKSSSLAGPWATASTTKSVVATGFFVETYFLRGISMKNGCADTILTTVIIHPDATIDTDPQNMNACFGQTITLSGSGSGPQTLVYQWENGPSGTGPWTPIAGATAANYTFQPPVGNNYYHLLIGGAEPGCQSDFTFPAFVKVDAPVQITAQPMPIEECRGGGAAISAMATTTSGNPKYAWQRTQDTLGVWSPIGSNQPMVSPSGNVVGVYFVRLVVSSPNNFCKDTSIIVTQTVVADPTISTQPKSISGCLGVPLNLSVTPSGGVGTFSYQWSTSSDVFGPYTDVTGATNSTFQPTGMAGITYFQVTIMQSGAGCNTILSNPVSVSLDEPIAFTTDPQPLTECLGGSQMMTTTLSSANFSFMQWQAGNAATGPFSNILEFNPDFTPPSSSIGTTFYRAIVHSQNNFCNDTTLVAAAQIVASPSITTQPAPYSGCLGNMVNLTVAATGGLSPLGFQWQNSASAGGPFSNINGANGANFTPPNTAGTQFYQVIVSPPAGSSCPNITSQPAAVTLDGSVNITTNPTNLVECSNAAQSLTVVATGTGNLNFQWQSSANAGGPFSNIGGATTTSFTPPSATAGILFYRVIVASQNGFCQDTSTVSMVEIKPNATISQQPMSFLGCLGNPISLTAQVGQGIPPISFQWQSSATMGGPFSNINGATTMNYNVPNVPSDQFFRLVVTSSGGCPSVNSQVVHIVLDSPVSVSTDPQAINECVGGSQPMSVSATGGSAQFQWQSATNANGPFSNIGGATQNSYTPPAPSAGTTFYRVVVISQNGFCKDTSLVAAAQIGSTASITTQPTNYSGCLGNAVNLTVGASGGTAPLGFQWQSAANAGGPFSNINGATTASFPVPNTAGTTFYQVVVSSAAGSGCPSVMSSVATVVLDGMVNISTQPTAISECIGGAQSTTATASGSGILSYQWQAAASQNGPFSNINGANSASFTPPNGASGSSFLRLVISSPNGFCKDTTNVVAVQIAPDPAITTQPTSYSGCAGSPFSLTTAATGGVGNLNFQWQSSASAGGPFSNINGATQPNFMPPNTVGTTFYQVVVSSTGVGCGPATSTAATVTIDPAVTISTEPQNVVECIGGTQNLSATATGGSFQWQSSANQNGPFSNINGANAANFTPTASAAGTTFFRLILSSTNGFCKDTSVVATVQVAPDFTISPQPQNYEACVGGSLTLISGAAGGILPTFQWQSAASAGGPFSNVAGANSATFNPPLTTGGTTFYQLVVSSAASGCGSVTSISAQVLLHPEVKITAEPQPISECFGGNQSLVATATGGTNLVFQWQMQLANGSWQNIAGATTANFTPPSNVNFSLKKYRLVVSDVNLACGADTSTVVNVQVETAFSIKNQVEICNFTAGSQPTTLDFGTLVLTGDPNPSWKSLDAPAPPGAWSAKDFTGWPSGQTFRFEATTTNAVAPCVNVKDTVFIKILDCCPVVCTNPPTVSLCNSAAQPFDLNTLNCAGIGAGGWFLTAGPGISGQNPLQNGLFDAAGRAEGSYTVTYVLSGNLPAVCASSSSETISIIETPEAGATNGPSVFCENQGLVVQLADLLTGEDAGGFWTNISTSPVAPNAFNAAAGTLNLANLSPGNFSFKYEIAGVSGCPGDAATVEITLGATPNVFAGNDAVLTCDQPTATIGSSQNPQSGSGINLLWKEIDHNGFVPDSTAGQLSIGEPGLYELTATNAATGCSATDAVEIMASLNFITDVLTELRDPTCHGFHDGKIKITSIVGGAPPISIAFNGGSAGAAQSFSGLAAGVFHVQITDKDGCSTERNLVLNDPPPLSVALRGDTTIWCGDSLWLAPVFSADTATLDWSWFSNLNAINTPDLPAFWAKPMKNAAFKVVVKNENGCRAEALTRILVDENLPIYAPTVFRPGSNDNSVFRIFAIEKVEKVRSFRIFERSGGLVFEQKNKRLDDADFGWDGSFGGKTVEPSVFVFVVELDLCDGQTTVLKGDVTVVR